MGDKILNTFSVESNGEIIEINTIQTEKGIVVSINGTTMDVLVNSEEIYSKFDNPDYKYIPMNLRNFVERHLCSWGDGIVKKDKKVQCELEFNGEEYYIDIPINVAKSKEVLICNWLNDYNKIQEYDVVIPNAKENFDKLIQDIKNIGYGFKIIHTGSEYDNVYGLSIPISKLSEDKVYECIKLWKDYNDVLEKYIGQI